MSGFLRRMKLPAFHEPLLTTRQFITHMISFVGVIWLLMSAWMGLGALICLLALHLPLDQSLYHGTLMIVGEQPPIEPPTWMGKVLVALFMLNSSLILVIGGGMVLIPLWHRVQHHHVQQKEKNRQSS